MAVLVAILATSPVFDDPLIVGLGDGLGRTFPTVLPGGASGWLPDDGNPLGTPWNDETASDLRIVAGQRRFP
ncbi:hypothetical protein [Actinocorallia lasiicapitis]